MIFDGSRKDLLYSVHHCMAEIENSPSPFVHTFHTSATSLFPEHFSFKSPTLLLDIHSSIYSWFKFTNILLDKSLHTPNHNGFLQSITPWTNLHLHASPPLWTSFNIPPSLDGRNFLYLRAMDLFWMTHC